MRLGSSFRFGVGIDLASDSWILDFVVCSLYFSQTLWYHFVARSSYQQHGAEENVCKSRMETNVAPLCSQDVKIQQKGVSRHYSLSDP